MLLCFLKLFGRLLAWLPPSLVAMLCRFIGLLVRILLPARTRSTLNSLSHAFPDKTEAWRRGVFRMSCARLAEMGLFRLASAYFSSERLEETLEFTPEAAGIIKDYEEGGRFHGRPVVIMLPHMTMSEAATMLPSLVSGLKPVHVIFRPLNQASINRWVTGEREKFGAKMISRRSGHSDAMAALRRGEMVAVLFDQDAATRGSVITFMDRIVSATDLPALMAHRFGADVYLMLLERQCFWRAKLTLTPIPLGDRPADVTIAAHDALEQYLRRSQETAADWLWMHNRWNYAYKPHRRFHLPEKRNQLARSNERHGYDTLPRKTRFWVRLPDRLGDLVMAFPVLRAIRAGRPDFEFTLIGEARFEGLVARSGLAEHFIPLPAKGAGYFPAFYALRKRYSDTYLVLVDSFLGDCEAFLTRCPQRFGMALPGKQRPMLTDPYRLPRNLEETVSHPVNAWAEMARRYGLREELDFRALRFPGRKDDPTRVGLICDPQSASGKCWSMKHWRRLLEGLLDDKAGGQIVLLGRTSARPMTEALAAGFKSDEVVDRAGQTTLSEFCEELIGCGVVCGHDTGGMHLANMLGTPVVAILGSSELMQREPVFDAPKVILRPKDGGIDQVTPERVREAVHSLRQGAENG